MNKTLVLVAAIAIAAPLAPALAWFHAGGWSGGGNRSSWSASSARGGHASGGGGSWNATGARGGTASGGGGSWSATGTGGHTVYGSPGYYHGGYYGAYNAPTVVNTYGAGCYNCGGWNTGGAVGAGVVAGAAIGAAAANAAATNPPGTIYGALPAGCAYQPAGGQPYYSCTDGLWFVPAYGANGVYYRVAAAP